MAIDSPAPIAADVDGTPKHVVFHPENGCALVVCEDSHGDSWLRLFHATSLRQVMQMLLMAISVRNKKNNMLASSSREQPHCIP